MDLRQLRYFVGIVQAGSLSRAADQMHVAQSALSHHLASLETELARQLVTRSPKGILLTEAGAVLYLHAESCGMSNSPSATRRACSTCRRGVYRSDFQPLGPRSSATNSLPASAPPIRRSCCTSLI